MSGTPSCATCEYKGLFMMPDGTIGSAVCRRHPPIVQFVTVAGPNGKPQIISPTAWPSVDDQQWCGEYKPTFVGLS